MKHFIIYIALSILLPSFCWAQEGSLFLELPQGEAVNEVYDLLGEARDKMESHPEVALSDLERALQLSLDAKNDEGKAYAYQYLAAVNHHHQRLDLAVKNYKRAIRAFEKVGNEAAKYHCIRNLGDAYQDGGNPNKSLEYHDQYLTWLDQNNDQKQQVQTLYRTGQAYQTLNDLDNSEQRYKKAVEIEEELGDTTGIIQSYNELGNWYLYNDKGSEAIENFQNGLNLASEVGDTVQLVQGYSNLSNAYSWDDNPEVAGTYTVQATDLAGCTNCDDNTLITLGNTNYQTAYAWTATDNAAEAIPLLEETIELYTQVEGTLQEQANAYKTLSENLVKEGKFERALENYQRYVNLVDSMQAERDQRLTQSIRLNQLLDEKEETIADLERDQDLNQSRIIALEKDQTLDRMLIWSLLGGLILVFIASVLIYRSSRAKRRANLLLALKSSRAQMNPHFIFNALNSVNSFIARNDERSANKYLSEFSKLMRTVLDNSKHDFVSLANEIQLLKLYLSLEHVRFKEKFDYDFDFETDLDSEELQVPPMLIQPYIENAIWHGLRYKDSKGKLRVNISRQNGHVKVLVEDNGIGRKRSQELKTHNQKSHSSTGLKSVQERLAIINDLHNTDMHVEIKDLYPDQQDAGTRVELQIPCNLTWN